MFSYTDNMISYMNKMFRDKRRLFSYMLVMIRKIEGMFNNKQVMFSYTYRMISYTDLKNHTAYVSIRNTAVMNRNGRSPDVCVCFEFTNHL